MIGKTNALTGGSSAAMENVNISITTNQSAHTDLSGAYITFTHGETTEKFTWGFEELNFQVEAGTQCSVSFSDVTGYKTPDTINFVTVSGNVRNITGEYKTTLLTFAVTGSGSSGKVYMNQYETVGVNEKYTRLEYIKSDGTNYIDTGFKPNQDTRVVMDVIDSSTGITKALFGVRNSDATTQFVLGYSMNDGWFYYVNGTSSNTYTAEQSENRVVLDCNKNVFSIDGTTAITNTYEEFDFDSSLFILGCSHAGVPVEGLGAVAKLYSCQIYDNGTLVRDYIPALNRYGEAGLYDAVEDRFYKSETETGFTKGAAVYESYSIHQGTFDYTYKVPFGTRWMFEADEAEGYIAPTIKVVDANEPSMTVTMAYVEGSVNVWVATESGKLIDPDNWKYIAGETPVGVAIVTENSSFVVDDYMATAMWTSSSYATSLMPSVPSPSETDIDNEVFEHYDGVSYTDEICKYGTNVDSTSSKMEISWWITAFEKHSWGPTFGGETLTPYVGSVGEWADLGYNMERVFEVLDMIGMSFKYASRPKVDAFWTSCQKPDDATRAYAFNVEVAESLGSIWFSYPLKSAYDEDEGPAIKPFYKL